jgi:hypothetical protein
MRRSISIAYYERNRDARLRFAARAWSSGNITGQRRFSQPGEELGPGVVGFQGIQDEVDATQQETKPLSVRKSNQISCSEEGTEQ